MSVATTRPTCSIYDYENPSQVKSTTSIPKVLTESPLRGDLCSFVHNQLSRNRIQARGVKYEAGYGTAAESWGTGRAVARIPRVPGGGTHRAGQAAFGNMCRGGGMFAPLKTWRRFHRKVNVEQKQASAQSALAASTVPALVMARGHRVSNVAELPIVISKGAEQSISKTNDLDKILRSIGLSEDLDRVKTTIHKRAGRGKSRDRKWVTRKGPLLVVSKVSAPSTSKSISAQKITPIAAAAKAIPGVDCVSVEKLSVLSLAPGGVFGRVIVWTEEAFLKLDDVFTKLHRPTMTNCDLPRLINSDEIQGAICPPRKYLTGETVDYQNCQNGRKLRGVNARSVLDPTTKKDELLKRKREDLFN